MLNINRLKKCYQTRRVLDDFSLQIANGELVLLLGVSGSGKSTLLRLLNGLDKWDSGDISLDGERLHSGVPHADIGMVFQSYALFSHLTVRANIDLALLKLKGAKGEETDALLSRFALLEHADKAIDQISGGQKQRLAIARALAMEPKYLCMDEPTAALDPSMTRKFAEMMQDLQSLGMTLFISTHDMALIKYLPCTIVLMNEGKVQLKVRSEAYLKSPEAYPQLQAYICE